MSVYMVGALDILEAAGYADYLRLAKISVDKIGATLLAASDAPHIIEGKLPAGRLVLMRFDDMAAFDKWYNSPEYKEAIPHRLESSAMSFMMVAEGVD